MAVGPRQAESLGDLDQDPQIVARIAGQRQRLAAHLHLAVGIGHRARLLRPSRRRQDHVGHHRRLGEEDVLHHEMLELGDAGAGMIEVGIRHRRVLALDIHAPDLAFVRRIDDLDHGEAGLFRQRRLPQLLELLVHR